MNFHAKSQVCSSKNAWVMEVGTARSIIGQFSYWQPVKKFRKTLIYTVELSLATLINANWLYKLIEWPKEPKNKQKWLWGEFLMTKKAKNGQKLRQMEIIAIGKNIILITFRWNMPVNWTLLATYGC